MGLYKKFTLALTNIAVPNLIAYDLVIVHPMTAMSGYVVYLEYTYGSRKGNTQQGTVINSPFALGDVDVDYTSPNVSVTMEAKVSTDASGAASGNLHWHPLIPGSINFVVNTVEINDNGEGILQQDVSGTMTNVGTVDYQTGDYTFTASGISAITPIFVNYS